jgi:hypothetical protein
MRRVLVSLGLTALLVTAAQAQGPRAAGNPAKQQACKAEAHDLTRRANARSGGANATAARAQWQGYYQSCMAR